MKLELDEDEKTKISSEIAQEVLKTLNPALFKLNISQDKVFTVETLAAYLLTTPKWVYNHVPTLPHFKVDGLMRFRKSDIDRLFDEIPSKVPTKR
jgi:hypothetical protein